MGLAYTNALIYCGLFWPKRCVNLGQRLGRGPSLDCASSVRLQRPRAARRSTGPAPGQSNNGAKNRVDRSRRLSVSRRLARPAVRQARLPSFVRRQERAVRGLGAERANGVGDRRMERLGPGRAPARGARRRQRRVGRQGGRRRARPGLQVPRPLQRRRARGRQGRSVRLLLRAPAGDRLARVDARLRVERRRVDEDARGEERSRFADGDLRAAPRLVAAQGRRVPHLPRAGARAGRIHELDGLHSRRADADHRASVLRLLGLPDHRLLRPHRALRHAAGLHVLRRSPAPAGPGRDPRLGAVAFPDRRARAGVLRRHAPVRARRPAPGLPPRMGLEHLQLRQERGTRLSHVLGPVLARQVPPRRAARGRGGVDALPRLRAQGRRVDPQPLRRQGKPGGDRFPAPDERSGLPRPPGHRHHRGGVDRLADGVAPGLRRRPGFRHEVEHGLDARQPART